MANSVSYLSSTATQNNAAVPKPAAKIAEPQTGIISRDWWRYLLAITSPPGVESGVNLGTSPTQYKAAANGTLLVYGGTVSAIQLMSRYNTSVLYGAPTSGFFPMSVGDTVVITYSSAPTVTWFPR